MHDMEGKARLVVKGGHVDVSQEQTWYRRVKHGSLMSRRRHVANAARSW
jgi:hypothetical protein